MPSAAPGLSSPALTPAERIAGIARFMQDASFEITRASAKDIEDLRIALPPGSPIYITALPGRPQEEMVASVLAVRAAGLEPVPHIAARHHRDFDSIDRLLAALAPAAVREILLIGGDMAPADGVRDAMSVIETGLLQRHGITSVGLPGFPEGHPQVSDEELESSLVTKTAALQSGGLQSHIVTQFCFDSKPVLAWLEWLRARGLNMPVRIGFAGPTSLMTWLNYARRCGVKASAEALASRSGLVKHAFKAVAPDPFVRTIAEAVGTGRYGEVKAHLFSFGGAGATARWAVPPMQGHISLTADGFEVVK
jgi:methylenetetrahydrofolate reductase (NADPH)